MKGIILAGGTGSRLHPLTRGVSKQLLPVYNKPMIYYPLSTLMLAGVREILIITTPEEQDRLQACARERRRTGFTVRLREAAQARRHCAGVHHRPIVHRQGSRRPRPWRQHLYGAHLSDLLKDAASREQGATVFGYQVRDPQRYGVVEFNAAGQAVSLEEKPKKPRSNFAVTGL